MTDRLEGRALVEYIDAHLDKTMERLERGYEPIWQAQADMGRTIITLSSSALILSVTVAQYLITKPVAIHSGWLLPTAWVLFVTAVIAGTLRHSWVSQARGMRALFELERAAIRKQLWDLEPGAELGDKVDEILDDAFTKASVQPAKGMKVHDALTQIMFWTFATGLVTLTVFAIRNVLF